MTVSGLPSTSPTSTGISSTAPLSTKALVMSLISGERLALLTTMGSTIWLVRGVPVPSPLSVAVTVTE